MATNKQRRLFEEIGLLNEEVQANPYQTLGLSQDFASEILTEDPSGDTLRGLAGALHKSLSRRYHPDVKPTGDSERFRAITDADKRIADASISSLVRWAKENRTSTSSSSQLRKLQNDNEIFVEKATDVLQATFEASNNPLHFSRLEDAQGVLLTREKSTMLMRQDETGGVQVRNGVVADLGSLKAATHETQAFDFRRFLSHNQSFGIEPNTDIVGYLDDNGRASILSNELKFIMDITDPVEARRRQRQRTSSAQNTLNDGTDQWLRRNDPVLIMTKTPDPASSKRPAARIVSFPDTLRGYNSSRKLTWELPMEVVGSVADKKFFSQMRSNKNLGAVAISGSDNQRSLNYFNMISAQARHIIDQAPGYTPLLQKGNSLMMYDEVSRSPIVTDAMIIGMIGSDSRAG